MHLFGAPVYQIVYGLPDFICQLLDDWTVRMVFKILSVLCSIPTDIEFSELILLDQAIPLSEQLLAFPLVIRPGQRFLEFPVSARLCLLKQFIINLAMDLKPLFQSISLPCYCLQRQCQHKILFLDILHSLFTSVAAYKKSGASPCRPESSGCV